VKYTFDVGKCDKIFDELLQIGKIIFTHAIPLFEELKRHAYSKWNDSYSHTTNVCNVFCRQIQSIINEELLFLKQMQVDKSLFSINTIDL
jgi:hypothetical protein